MWWLGTAAWAGVWVHPAGQGYAQLVVQHQEADRMFLPGGSTVAWTDPALLGSIAPLLDEGGYAQTGLAAYGELGLGRGFEVVASLPVSYVQNRWSLAQGSYPDVVQRNLGFGDLSAGARFGGSHRGFAYSAWLSGVVPLYDNGGEALNMEAGNSDFEDDRVPLGTGTIDLGAGGGAGYGGARGWALVDAGVQVRDRRYSAVVPTRVQVGAKPVDRVSAWVGATGTWSLGNGRAPDFFRDQWGKGPIALDAQSSLSADVGAIVDLVDGWGLTADLSRVLWGSRFPRLTGASAGVCWNFRLPERP